MAEKPVLSDDEIDALMGTSVSHGEARSQTRSSNAKRYDFSGREKALFAQMPGLKQLNEKAGAELAGLIADRLRISFEVELQDIGIVEADRLTESFEEGAVISVARLEPLQGLSLVEVPAALLQLITESYFGGTAQQLSTTAAEGCSRSEIRVHNRLVGLLFQAVESGWSTALKCQHEIISTQTDVQFLRQPGARSKSVCVVFRLSQAEQFWSVRWIFPYSSLEPLREVLGQAQQSSVAPQVDWTSAMSSRLLDVALVSSAVLLEMDISLGQVMQLKTGSIIPIRMPQNAEFRVEDVPLMLAEYGANESRKALKLLNPCNDR